MELLYNDLILERERERISILRESGTEGAMRIAICDDEAAQRQYLGGYVQEWGDSARVRVDVAFFDSSESFLFAWEDDKAYDLVMLDIEMGKLSGIDLAVKIREQDQTLPILFVTGYEEYMEYGYDVAALHYLVKPVKKDRLFAVLNRVWEGRKPEEKVLLETDQGMAGIGREKIWYAEAAGHQCILCLEKESLYLKCSIGTLEELLSGAGRFVKCHRSYLVNLEHAAAVRRTEVVLDDGRKVPLSRYLYRQVNQAFVEFYRKSP